MSAGFIGRSRNNDAALSSVRASGSVTMPQQFRTRNERAKMQRTPTNSSDNEVKSTKLIDILPLITVWLQVRVLPGPPVHQMA